jgi:rubrerythrin
MIKSYGVPDNAELFFKCSQCGNMFEPQKKGAANCPICGNFCTPNSCKLINSSNEDY